MENIYLVEPSFLYEDIQVRLPYSTGLIWSHCKTNKIIEKNYKLSDILFIRDEIDKFVDNIHNPSVIGFSCFVWNWAFNNEVAKVIKEKYPDCVIVYGGQHQPSADRLKHEKDFFKKHSYVNMLVHGEGELTFEQILLENLKEKDWSKVTGITYQTNNYKFVTTLSTPRITDIDSMPSPYLDGTFNNLVEKYKDKNFRFTCTIEGVRGCPYRCTFCEIGSLYFQKLQRQSFNKLKKEIEWMSENKVVYIDNADSNFGLFEDRDLKVAKLLVYLKKKKGFPISFRNDWAKDRGERCIPIAKVLNEEDLNKGLTLAFQSLYEPTLKAIMRKNVTGKYMKEFLKKCKEENLPIYVELILGLPEETLESFKRGIFTLMNNNQHNYIGIYPLSILPNTPFGDPVYIKKYGVKYRKTKSLSYHITNTEMGSQEDEKIVCETNTMTHEEILKAHNIRWFLMICHFFGTTQFIARFFKNYLDISYESFYDKLYEYFIKKEDTVLGDEIKKFKVAIKEVFNDSRYWGWYLEDGRTWEFDEGSIFKIFKQKDQFYREIRRFIVEEIYADDLSIIDSIMEYQENALIIPDKKYPYKLNLDYNIHDVVKNNKNLMNGDYVYDIDGMPKSKNYNGDMIKWCRELYWWGRKEGRYKSIIRSYND